MSDRFNLADVMDSSGVKFGTSGARGLATAMTDRVCYIYTVAFLQYLQALGDIRLGDYVVIAGDFRPSSPRIMSACAQAIENSGFLVLNGGFIPTPAVVAYAMSRGIASLMVTGSHIPDDRNGIKFNKPTGEILKDDEQGIIAQNVAIANDLFSDPGALLNPVVLPVVNDCARGDYIDRYLDFFPAQALSGLRVAVYQHSTVARDVMVDICKGLGADVVALARSEVFVPVDTEAIREDDIVLARKWSLEHSFDCIISADGDGDRPLVSDENGNWLRGDVAGILCARYLGATAVATPVSSNSALEKSGWFECVERTQIGSPYVIAAMNQLLAEGYQWVVGYEANGGFLIASDINKAEKTISALPTRDAVIVPLAIMMLSKENNGSISQLLAGLPARYTYSDRLKAFPTKLSQQRIAALSSADFTANKQAINEVLEGSFGELVSIDQTDGLRMTFDQGDILHLRPSGNAPELRCYSESSSEAQAMLINQRCMQILTAWRDSL